MYTREMKNRSEYRMGQVNLMYSDLAVIGKIRWDIENFRNCRVKIGESIVSPKFSSVSHLDIDWEFILYPKGENVYSQDFMAIYIKPIGQLSNDIHVVVSILNETNNESHPWSVDIRSTSKDLVWGCRRYIRRSVIFQRESRLINDGKLTILFNIKTRINNDVCAEIGKAININNNNNDEQHPFENLVNNEKFSDVTFIISSSNKKIYGHKIILSAISEKFKEMFDKTECTVVEVEDIDYEVFLEMIRYIYCEKIHQFDNRATDLLAAAKIHGLKKLVNLCENFLCKNLSIDNAIKYLNLADSYNAERLKAKSIGFIIANGKEISKKPEFKTVAELHADLIVEVFSALVSQG